MKKYVVPKINSYDLRSEESISTCWIAACTDADGDPIWIGNQGLS